MKHYVITILLLSLTALGQWNIHGTRVAAGEEDIDVKAPDLPSAVGPYRQRGEDLPIDEHVREVLQTSSILMREYIAPEGRLMGLTIVYVGATRQSLHFPEVCLTGQGWEVREQFVAPVGLQFTARHLVLVKGEQQQAVLYWFKTGPRFTDSFFKNTLYWTRERVLFGSPSSSMIKLSTSVGRAGEEAAFRSLEDFAEKLAPILMERIP